MALAKFRPVRILFLLALFHLLLFPASAPGHIEEATAILERWTSFHWGRDCLVWIVHYPEELVDPWVESEAARGGMSEAEKEDYRKAFVSDLRIGDTEPFLVTIYAFGPRPLDFEGFADAVSLTGGEGRKIKPLSYERKFDQPVSGIVQGLVFFPKQPDKNFSLAMKRLGVVEEQQFSFAPRALETTVASVPEELPREVVVVELPPAPQKAAPKPKPQEASPPPPPPPVPAPQEELEDLKPLPEPDPSPPPVPVKDQVVFISRDKTLELFVGRWIEGDTAGMYDLLSSDTRTILNEEQFGRQVAATGLRVSLRDGYKVQWQEGDRAKVITAQKMLVFRTLRSKMLTLAKEGKIWKVTW